MKYHCRETLARAYLYLDGEVLSEQERQEIWVHLEECKPCYDRVGLDREVTEIVARLKGAHRCPDELRSRLSQLLNDL
ncbi:MAG: zf-HC2 domain-containing protein [Actinomycetota bacterium]|nr:zf-HC2 domain-containing protein [Actinomycetota bacterium]